MGFRRTASMLRTANVARTASRHEEPMVLQRPPDAREQEPIGTSRLSVVMAAPVGIDSVITVLGRARASWLGEVIGSVEDVEGGTRHLVELELRVSDRAPRVTFRKAAHVELGPLRFEPGGGLVVDISWRAAGMTPLFPVFAGSLRWQEGQLQLDGVYAPPGGTVGAVADRVLLNVAARGTGRRLLERAVEVMSEGYRP
jgi:hypothetical protein